jgi:hypothetical protein
MTHDDNIERVLERWFTEGPRHMPDRLFDGTFERIERLPKHRLADLRLRLPAMQLNARLLAAAAVIVALFGVGIVVLNAIPGVGSHPSPTPPSSSAPTAIPAALMTSIQTKWTTVGDRPIPGSTFSAQFDFTIGPSSISMNGFKGWVASSWSAAPDGSLLLRLNEPQGSLTGQHWTCTTGDDGSYGVALSASGQTLSLTVKHDACPTRQSILVGDWTRWPCPNPNSVCQAELTPGRHVAAAFAPAAGQPLAYTVPAGWSNVVDTDFDFWLGRPNDPGTMGISVYLDVAPHSQAVDCLDVHEPGVGTTAAEITTWLSKLPNLVSTTPAPITIGGYHGMAVDLSVAPGWTRTCTQYPDAPGLVLTLADLVTLPQEEGSIVRATLAGAQHSRYVLLDLGSGHNMFIEATGPDEARWTEFVAAAMPIIENFEFGP